MEYELRDYLATEFAGVIKNTREEQWDIFCKRANESNLDPCDALARLLVRIVEATLDGPDLDRN